MRGGKSGMGRKVTRSSALRDSSPTLTIRDDASPIHHDEPSIRNGNDSSLNDSIFHEDSNEHDQENAPNNNVDTNEHNQENSPLQPIINAPIYTPPYVEVHNNTFVPINPAYGTLKHIIHSHYDGVYICFSEVSDDTKELWWKEFQKKFQWDKTRFYDDVVYKAFKHKASDHIRNALAKARISGVSPPWMAEDIWNGLVKRWKECPKFLRRSETNKLSRAVATVRGMPPYSGGSISTSAHKRLLKDILKRDPTPKETFAKCYKKKDGTWSGKKAQDTAETYDKLFDQATQLAATTEGSPLVDTNRLWIEAAGGVKKGRIFGMGSEARGVIQMTQHGMPSQPPILPDNYENLKEEMRTSVQEVREEITQTNQNWQKMFEQLIEGQNALANKMNGLVKKKSPK